MVATAPARAARSDGDWVASWGAAQMTPGDKEQLPPVGPEGATLRQVVRLTLGGGQVRVRFSNLFGTAPLVVGAAHLARAAAPGRAAVIAGTDRALRFAGRPTVTIPPGAEIYSDAVDLPVTAADDVAVSLFLPRAPDRQTGHPGSRATSFLVAGDRTGQADLTGATRFDHWFQLADVEVAAPEAAAVVVAIGDSITDGHGATTNGNDRWTDGLAQRLRAAGTTRAWGVVNAGIGGGRVLLDGIGPNLLARFDRDVIARSGVSAAIVLEGVNDLGVLTRDAPAEAATHAALVTNLTDAYHQLAERAHAHHLRLIGATITPFAGSDYYHPGPATEADRQALNRFIRTSGTFDGVVDFDAALRDPAHPERLLPAYDSGDHLHPSPAGYRAMATAVPLALLTGEEAGGGAGAPALALTFDDIPAHGPLPPGTDRLAVIDGIIDALKKAGAPAQGFLNAGFGLDDPESPTVVAHWRAAGFPLGNHGYAHLGLSKVGATPFLADVARGEPMLAEAMAGQDWHWFRYPFLDEGANPAEVAAARAGFRARHYRVGAVTMSFGDYAWNPPYARCRAANNQPAVAGLEQSYLEAARDDARRMRALSAALYGRDIPYVLLMHVGAFDAHMLPRLLAQYREMGFRFVTLADAERDPVYAAAVDLARPGPTPSLDAAARARGLPISPVAAPAPSATLCS